MSTNEITSDKEPTEASKSIDPNNTITRQNGKSTGFNVFLDLCQKEHLIQNPDVQIQENDFLKKCTHRWKNMTKKEKSCFDVLSKRKK